MSQLGNVQVRNHTLRTFVINPLFHICQKEKIRLGIKAVIASLSKPIITAMNKPTSRISVIGMCRIPFFRIPDRTG